MAFGDTELGPTKNDLIIEAVQKELGAKSKVLASGKITDYSSRAVKGTQSISVPKGQSFNPVDRASGIAGTNQEINYTTDTIALDKRKHIQWVVDQNDEIESSIDVELENAMRAAKGHARQFDIDAFATMENVASQTILGAPAAVSRDDVLGMREEILHQEGDDMDMSYWCSVDQYHNLLKVPEFTEVRLYGDQIIKNGLVGTLYGIPVYMSSLVTAGQIYCIEKAGIGFAFQRMPSMDERNAPEYGSGAKLKVMDQKYGFGGLELGVDSGNGSGPVAADKSPLVVKLV